MSLNCLPFQPVFLWIVLCLYFILILKCLISFSSSKSFTKSSFESTLPWEPCNLVFISYMIFTFFHFTFLNPFNYHFIILIVSKFCPLFSSFVFLIWVLFSYSQIFFDIFKILFEQVILSQNVQLQLFSPPLMAFC